MLTTDFCSLIKSSLTICESAAALETDPDLHPWAWYAGAYQQYHTSVFLLMEILRYPTMPYAERINATLGHVFSRAPNVSTAERNQDILRLLAEGLERMRQARKVSMQQYSPSVHSNDVTATAFDPGEAQWMGSWQPEMGFRQEYLRTPTLTPETVEDQWWNYPSGHGMGGFESSAEGWGEGYAMSDRMY